MRVEDNPVILVSGRRSPPSKIGGHHRLAPDPVPLIDLDRMPLIDLADEHQAAREETWFCLEWETGNLAMHMVERDLGRGGALRP